MLTDLWQETLISYLRGMPYRFAFAIGLFVLGIPLTALADDGWYEQEATDESEEAPEPSTRRERGEAPPSGDEVVVHIDSDEPVELYEMKGRHAKRVVCVSPCDAPVDVGHHRTFLVRGQSVRKSERFNLTGYGDSVSLDVTPSSRGQLAGGIVMTSLGGLGILFGITAAAIGVGWNDEGMSTAGGITIGAGAGVLTGGIFLITGSRTDIEIVPQGEGVAVSPALSVGSSGASLGLTTSF